MGSLGPALKHNPHNLVVRVLRLRSCNPEPYNMALTYKIPPCGTETKPAACSELELLHDLGGLWASVLTAIMFRHSLPTLI